MQEFLNAGLPGLWTVMGLMFGLWVYAVKRTNAGVVDLGWAIGLTVMCGTFVLNSGGYMPRKLLIFAMVLVWCLRISTLLLSRFAHEKEEDGRYQRIRQAWGKNINLKFLLFFQFQALLDFVLSIPFFLICQNPAPALTVLEYAAAGIFLIGLIGETLADAQLKQFRSNPANKGKVCQNGLWNYSRHPNYFFEWLMWVSYFIFALGHPNGWLAVIAPAIMLHLLINVSGIPMIEQHALRTKGEAFKEYVRTTSFFVPLPKRR